MSIDLDWNAIIKQVKEENNLHKYKPHEQVVSQWCKENEVTEVERLKLPADFYKMQPKEQDKEIAKAIKTMYPDRIDEHVYHFPFQWFYLITDKNYYFTLKSKPRPRTDKEEDKISYYREIVKRLESDKFYKEARSAYETVKSLRKMFSNIGPDLTNQIFKEKHYNVLTSWKEAKEDINAVVKKLESKCRKEKYFALSPHKLTRQVSIYINGRIMGTLERLGYKIYKVTRPEIVREWNEQYLNWDYNEVEATHHFIKVDGKVFINACKTGRLLPKGKYLDEDGNEVELKKGRAKGCANDHLCKQITLFDPMSNQVLSFSSMQDAAKQLGVDKGNLSKKLKGLVTGDAVTIKKHKFIIGNTNGKECND